MSPYREARVPELAVVRDAQGVMLSTDWEAATFAEGDRHHGTVACDNIRGPSLFPLGTWQSLTSCYECGSQYLNDRTC